MLKASLKEKEYEKYAAYFLEELEKKAPYAYIEATRSLLNYGKKKISCLEVNNIYLNAAKSDNELDHIYRLLVGINAQSNTYSIKPFNFEKVIENIFVMIHNKNPELLAQLEKLDISNRLSKNFSSPQEIVSSVLEEIKKIAGLDYKEWEINLHEATGLKDIVSSTPIESQSLAISEIKEHTVQVAPMIDERLLFILQSRLSAADIITFAKIIFLFIKSIISYNEMCHLAEHFFVQAGKEWCADFKKEVEFREQSRSSMNNFNIKNHIQEIADSENKSYKRIQKCLRFMPPKNAIINKEYMCLAQGTESQGNGDEVKKIIKIQPEINLLSIEDQMYEVDLTLSQLKFVYSILKKCDLGPASPASLNSMLLKVANIGIIQQLLGGKGLELLNKINTEPFMLQFMTSLIAQKIEQIQTVVREKLQAEWFFLINENYYKALDLRSSYIKLLDKKFFSPKYIIHELKTKAQASTNVLLLNHLSVIFGTREQTISLPIEGRRRGFYRPLFAFDLSDPKICSDILFFLRFFVRYKAQNADKERVQGILEKLIESYFCITGDFDKEELLCQENVAEIVIQMERRLYPHKPFFVGEKISIEENAAKLCELHTKVKEINLKENTAVQVEEMDQKKIEKIFNEIIDLKNEEVTGETVIASMASKKSPKSFFASSTCYLTIRYFTILYERFFYVRKFSTDTFSSDLIYVIFKRVLLYYLSDIIDMQKYEDLLRMLLDLKAGAFFSIDKIFYAFCKNQLDDLCSYALNVYSGAFDSTGATSEPEETIFAKICYKHFEIQGAPHKAGKNSTNSATKGAMLDNNELIKFDYYVDKRLLCIHRIKSIFPSALNTLGKLVDKSSAILFLQDKKEAGAKDRRTPPLVWRYNISKHFKVKQQKTVSLFSKCEDFVSRGSPQNSCSYYFSKENKLREELFDDILASKKYSTYSHRTNKII